MALIILFLFITSCSNNDKQDDTNISKQKITQKEFTQEELENDDELKSVGLENVLGKSSNLVGHAIIPFDIGGAVDMFYYPNGIKGTGFATMELLKPDGTGPIPNRMGTYELIAFTKLNYTQDTLESNPFNLIERRICGIFTAIGNYSFETKLEPGETGEVPGKEGEPTQCLIFDEYKPNGKEFFIGKRKHGLLLIIEIFRDEMEYAMQNGGNKLLEKLKARNYYPYSDLNRVSVIK